MSSKTTYSFPDFKAECQLFVQAVLDSTLNPSFNLEVCELVTVSEDDPAIDFLPLEIQSYIHLQMSKSLND